MENLQNFSIPFVGLKSGKSIFTYEITNAFFQNYEASPIKEGDVYVHLTFDKKESFFILDFFIDGSITTDCDRCLENFELPVNGYYKLFIKFEEEDELRSEDDDADVIFMSKTEIELNIADLIYEYINLSMPIQKFCEMGVINKKSCNEEVLKILDNKQKSPDGQNDPRWEMLKKLNNN